MTTLRLLACTVLLATARVALAEAPAPPAPVPPVPHTDQSRSLRLVAGVEAGGATTLRLGALYAFERSVTWNAFHMDQGYFGVGPSLALVAPDLAHPAAGQVGVTGRFANFGDAGLFSFELGAAVAFGGGRTLGVLEVGAFVSFFYVDLGYVAHIPLTAHPPSWLAVHTVALRVVIPVVRWDRVVSGPDR